MDKKTLMTFLVSISCDDTQICLHNWDDGIPYSLFNISITDDKNRSIELTCSRNSGIIVLKGECNFQTLKTIKIIDDFINAQSHVDYRKDYNNNGTL